MQQSATALQASEPAQAASSPGAAPIEDGYREAIEELLFERLREVAQRREPAVVPLL